MVFLALSRDLAFKARLKLSDVRLFYGIDISYSSNLLERVSAFTLDVSSNLPRLSPGSFQQTIPKDLWETYLFMIALRNIRDVSRHSTSPLLCNRFVRLKRRCSLRYKAPLIRCFGTNSSLSSASNASIAMPDDTSGSSPKRKPPATPQPSAS